MVGLSGDKIGAHNPLVRETSEIGRRSSPVDVAMQLSSRPKAIGRSMGKPRPKSEKLVPLFHNILEIAAFPPHKALEILGVSSYGLDASHRALQCAREAGFPEKRLQIERALWVPLSVSCYGVAYAQ
jgi:hypothetical protein